MPDGLENLGVPQDPSVPKAAGRHETRSGPRVGVRLAVAPGNIDVIFVVNNQQRRAHLRGQQPTPQFRHRDPDATLDLIAHAVSELSREPQPLAEDARIVAEIFGRSEVGNATHRKRLAHRDSDARSAKRVSHDPGNTAQVTHHGPGGLGELEQMRARSVRRAVRGKVDGHGLQTGLGDRKSEGAQLRTATFPSMDEQHRLPALRPAMA